MATNAVNIQQAAAAMQAAAAAGGKLAAPPLDPTDAIGLLNGFAPFFDKHEAKEGRTATAQNGEKQTKEEAKEVAANKVVGDGGAAAVRRVPPGAAAARAVAARDRQMYGDPTEVDAPIKTQNGSGVDRHSVVLNYQIPPICNSVRKSFVCAPAEFAAKPRRKIVGAGSDRSNDVIESYTRDKKAVADILLSGDLIDAKLVLGDNLPGLGGNDDYGTDVNAMPAPETIRVTTSAGIFVVSQSVFSNQVPTASSRTRKSVERDGASPKAAPVVAAKAAIIPPPPVVAIIPTPPAASKKLPANVQACPVIPKPPAVVNQATPVPAAVPASAQAQVASKPIEAPVAAAPLASAEEAARKIAERMQQIAISKITAERDDALKKVALLDTEVRDVSAKLLQVRIERDGIERECSELREKLARANMELHRAREREVTPVIEEMASTLKALNPLIRASHTILLMKRKSPEDCDEPVSGGAAVAAPATSKPPAKKRAVAPPTGNSRLIGPGLSGPAAAAVAPKPVSRLEELTRKSAPPAPVPTFADRQRLTEMFQLLTVDQTTAIFKIVDEYNPALAIHTDDEVELDVERFTPDIFRSVSLYAKMCLAKNQRAAKEANARPQLPSLVSSAVAAPAPTAAAVPTVAKTWDDVSSTIPVGLRALVNSSDDSDDDAPNSQEVARRQALVQSAMSYEGPAIDMLADRDAMAAAEKMLKKMN